MRRNRQAQQFIEHLLLFTVVLIGILVFVGPLGPFRSAVNRVIDKSLNEISVQNDKLNKEIAP